MLKNDLFYYGDKLQSYNALFNFIVGQRGGGKTFYFKVHAIQRFKKTGAQFVYLRRYGSELDKIDTFFDDIAEFFPDDELRLAGGNFYLNDQIMGFYFPLSISKSFKSVPTPKVEWIIFDEFLPMGERKDKYLTDECTKFFEMYLTVARHRSNVKVFFVGNAISTVNPYFAFFRLVLRNGKNFQAFNNGQIVVEKYANSNYIEHMKTTPFGQLMQDTAYWSYALENEFFEDNYDRIKKRSGESRKICQIFVNGVGYSFWYCNGEVFVDTSIDESFYLQYSLDLKSTSSNRTKVKSYRDIRSLEFIRNQLNLNNVYYDSLTTQYAVLDIYNLLKF